MVAFFTTIIGVFLAATAAYAFSRYRFPGYRPALTAFLITQMFPAAILLVPIYNIILHLGLLNQKLGLVLAYCTTAVPFCVWMLKGYFDTIPISIEEAGRIDGLTPFGTFWRIVIPLSLPGLAVTFFYSFITAWNEVAFANILLVSDKSYTLPVGPPDLRLPVRRELGEDDRRRCHHHPPRRARLPDRPALPRLGPHARRGQGLTFRASAPARDRNSNTGGPGGELGLEFVDELLQLELPGAVHLPHGCEGNVVATAVGRPPVEQ